MKCKSRRSGLETMMTMMKCRLIYFLPETVKCGLSTRLSLKIPVMEALMQRDEVWLLDEARGKKYMKMHEKKAYLKLGTTDDVIRIVFRRRR